MAQNIYYESGSEPYEGKLAVATVTMNRVKSRSFPQTVCEVVFQRNPRGCQFSWVCEKNRRAPNQKLFAEANRIALEVLQSNKRLHSIGNAMFFHNMTVKPTWSLTMTPIKKIGGHIFYVLS